MPICFILLASTPVYWTEITSVIKVLKILNGQKTIQQEGFERVFLGENCWHAIRIGGGMLDKIRYIAAYQTAPVSAITHLAPVDKIEPFGDGGKYKLIFSEPAHEIKPIPFEDAPKASMMSPRYTSINKLKEAKKLSDLL
ncbi:MAG: hypothetical protein QNJ55_25100 [Xenococcus sp. MO_188.B8]|nr:hypothetical protein [Xenococcus sp. MO_188.B8]